MDYKKKYENALEWARQVINGECGFIRKDVEEVFPELKESEYERIRKGMLQGFKDYGEPEYVWWEGVKVKECIAWLEKQGEHKHNWCEGCNNAKGCVACVDGSEWAHIEEHNPAWSEEDEERLNSCLNILQAKTLVGNTETINTKWLKSLKQRFKQAMEGK